MPVPYCFEDWKLCIWYQESDTPALLLFLKMLCELPLLSKRAGRNTQNKNGLIAWRAERSVQELWCSEVHPSSLPELPSYLPPPSSKTWTRRLPGAGPSPRHLDPSLISWKLTHLSHCCSQGKASDSYSNKVTCGKAPLDSDYLPKNLPSVMRVRYGDLEDAWVPGGPPNLQPCRRLNRPIWRGRETLVS